MLPVLVLLEAYLLGSIPFGYLIVRASEGGDVRETGSRGTGATNVTRRAGRVAGLATLLLDALKGVAAVLIAERLTARGFDVNWTVALASVAVIVGHCFPVWLRFRGGKGVATGIGVFLALCPLAVVCGLLIFLPVVWITRYVSLGSILTAIAMPIFVALLTRNEQLQNSSGPLLTAAIMCSALIVFMHRANIVRLMNGTESKFK